jgi:hypothetical protein
VSRPVHGGDVDQLDNAAINAWQLAVASTDQPVQLTPT